MTIRIVADSTCDLPAETAARCGIRVVPLYTNVGAQGFRDGIDMTREDFYRRLPFFPAHPTTAAPGQQKFRELYDSLASESTTQVLSIHILGRLSSVMDVARLAAQEATSTDVTVFDSRQLSLGTGFLVETAAVLAAQGRSINEITASLNHQIKRSHVFAALNTWSS